MDLEPIRQVSILDIAHRLLRPAKQNEYCEHFYHIHDRDSASLKIYPETNTWYCFGCKEHGDNISLVMQSLNVGFLDACGYIAGDSSLKPQIQAPSVPYKQYELKVTFKEVNQWSTALWYSQEGEQARAYLMQRGIYNGDFSQEAQIAQLGYRHDKRALVIPYVDYPAKLRGVRYRSIEGKSYWSETGSRIADMFYNNAALYRNPDKPIWWFESELDANLVSEILRRSCGMAKWHKHAILKPRSRYIYLIDNDEAGHNFAMDIRTHYFNNPYIEFYVLEHKDIGDWYQADSTSAIDWIKEVDNVKIS